MFFFAKPSYQTETFLNTTGTMVPMFLQPCRDKKLVTTSERQTQYDDIFIGNQIIRNQTILCEQEHF